MKLVQSIRMGAWLAIILSLLMAFGSIWVFLRMAPVIDNIIKQNTRTLVSCERMLVSLALNTDDKEQGELQFAAFRQALEQAEKNITESEEPEAIQEISRYYEKAFDGDRYALKKTTEAIVRLSDINKHAMVVEDRKARRLGSAGAWGVVFMATAVFLVSMLLMRSIRKNLIYPVEEIYRVVDRNLKGDVMRRCSGSELPRDVKVLYERINEVLDSASKAAAQSRFEK